MKTNIFYNIIAVASIFLAVSACTNLDEDVYDKIPADSFGSSETEINALVGTAYKTMKNYFADGNFMALDDMAGSCTVTPTRKGGDWYDGGQYREIYMHTYTPQTSCIKGAWGNASSAIGTCNANLAVVEKSTILSASDKTQKTAEIRAVRAFWLYKMMDEWGDVPLVTDYSDKTLPSRHPRQEVFDWLISEINSILPNLPDRDGSYGRFTKGAGYTLLSVLYLNADAWGLKCDHPYQKVIECCDKVINMGYVLEPDYATNFSANNENSNEAIFAIPFSNTDTDKDNRCQLMNRTLHYKDKYALGISASTWNGVCTQPDYVRLYDQENDVRFKDTFLIGQMYDITTGAEIITDHGRPLNHTIDVSMIEGTEYDGTAWGAVNQEDGARCIKWPFENDLVDAMGNDFHLFRYAEVLLMKAEALVRMGQDNATATQLVNTIRKRAFGNSNHNYSSVGLPEIQLERRLEFAWELKSRQDDIRFGCYEKGMWSASGCDRSTDSYRRLFPVSQDAINTNQNLSQNDGYK